MKRFVLTFTIILLTFISSQAQSAFAVKKWKGPYPRMNSDYPLSFVCWKGWLPPVPHFFVRIYPTHYYYYLNSLPVYDTKSYVNMGLYDGLKMVLKNIDKNALQNSLEEISGIKLNQTQHEGIEDFLRQSRLTELPDIYNISLNFYEALQALNLLKAQNIPNGISQTFEEDIRRYLDELLMINQLDAKQGDKLKAMTALNQEVRQLTGIIHYTAHKVNSYQQLNNEQAFHLAFLGSL